MGILWEAISKSVLSHPEPSPEKKHVLEKVASDNSALCLCRAYTRETHARCAFCVCWSRAQESAPLEEEERQREEVSQTGQLSGRPLAAVCSNSSKWL